MTPELTPQSILSRAMVRFNELAPGKYWAGDKEHGGLLTNRDCIAEMEKEVIDFWFYLQAFRQKRELMEEVERTVNRMRTLREQPA